MSEETLAVTGRVGTKNKRFFVRNSCASTALHRNFLLFRHTAVVGSRQTAETGGKERTRGDTWSGGCHSKELIPLNNPCAPQRREREPVKLPVMHPCGILWHTAHGSKMAKKEKNTPGWWCGRGVAILNKLSTEGRRDKGSVLSVSVFSRACASDSRC